jgi:mRNA interferase RelE/StbE
MSSSVPYSIILSDAAIDALQDLDKTIAKRIAQKIAWIATNADTLAHAMMTGEWHGFYRYRVGDYRIIYLLDSEERWLEIVLIGHRRDVYDI